MPYIAVFFGEGPTMEDENLHAEAHDEFVTSLIKRNLVLLGGGFSQEVNGTWAAYVLRCADLDEARAIAAEDPFVTTGVMTPLCVEWRLVGINPEAIEADTILKPEDV
jgi:uncharacterized protein YciI